MKYKVIKEFPLSPEIGFIINFDNIEQFVYKERFILTSFDCKNNPEFFEKSILTTDDEVDVFNNDVIYMVDDNKITSHWAFLSTREVYPKAKFYSTKERAELHLHKFRIGDIVKTCNGVGRIKSIFEDSTRWDTPYTAVNVEYILGKSTQNVLDIKIATDEEIEMYYRTIGWGVGCSFKYKDGQIYKLNKISIVVHRMWVWHKRIDGSLSAFLIDECELIVNEYPKSWEDLKKIDGWYINDDSKISKITNCQAINEYTDLCFTKKQCESILAFAQLTQLHAEIIKIYNKENNCDWKPVYSTTKLFDTHHKTDLFVVVRGLNKIEVNVRSTMYHHLVFSTRELAEFSAKHHKKLWEQYYEI